MNGGRRQQPAPPDADRTLQAQQAREAKGRPSGGRCTWAAVPIIGASRLWCVVRRQNGECVLRNYRNRADATRPVDLPFCGWYRGVTPSLSGLPVVWSCIARLIVGKSAAAAEYRLACGLFSSGLRKRRHKAPASSSPVLKAVETTQVLLSGSL